jgi:SAM-dependent methyltransferase
MPVANDDDIADYYDANTSKFLRFGGSGDVAAIHRAIWAPEVTNRQQAFQALNARVADSIRPLVDHFTEPFRIMDLGCGVGGTATWLHHTLGADVLGISISGHQVRLAQERAQRLGCGDHVVFVTDSFDSFTAPVKHHAACAIESFVHCQDPDQFLNKTRENLLPGGRLVICDDFVNPILPPEANVWIQQFRRGWQINQLLNQEDFLALADKHGFRLLEMIDLSAYVRPFPKLSLFIMSRLTRLPLPGSYWQNLAGGTALQVCIQRSYTCYLVIVLERV